LSFHLVPLLIGEVQSVISSIAIRDIPLSVFPEMTVKTYFHVIYLLRFLINPLHLLSQPSVRSGRHPISYTSILTTFHTLLPPSTTHRSLTNVQPVTVRFKPVGSAPILRTLVFKISASMKFETVVNFLRKKLDCKPTDSVFLYVNSVFAPGLDEGVGNLFRVSGEKGLFLIVC
jgi:Ubiquitin-like autophagy protein Apg12